MCCCCVNRYDSWQFLSAIAATSCSRSNRRRSFPKFHRSPGWRKRRASDRHQVLQAAHHPSPFRGPRIIERNTCQFTMSSLSSRCYQTKKVGRRQETGPEIGVIVYIVLFAYIHQREKWWWLLQTFFCQCLLCACWLHQRFHVLHVSQFHRHNNDKQQEE